MQVKSIEIYYDVSAIPGLGEADPVRVLDFQSAAMELIENALLDADAGEGAGDGASDGPGAQGLGGAGQLAFGFDVADFDRAEAIVRSAVKGTPYQNIRQIERQSVDPNDFA